MTRTILPHSAWLSALSVIVAATGALGGCAGDEETGQSVDHATDWGSTCVTNAGAVVECGASPCGWNFAGAGECVPVCSDTLVETIGFAVVGPEISYTVPPQTSEADCHLGELEGDDGYEQNLSVEYRDADGNALSLWIMNLAGPGDYNIDGGPIGQVLANFRSSGGLELHSTACSVSLAVGPDGGIQGTGFRCGLYEGAYSEFQADLDAEFSCSPQALWYYR